MLILELTGDNGDKYSRPRYLVQDLALANIRKPVSPQSSLILNPPCLKVRNARRAHQRGCPGLSGHRHDFQDISVMAVGGKQVGDALVQRG